MISIQIQNIVHNPHEYKYSRNLLCLWYWQSQVSLSTCLSTRRSLRMLQLNSPNFHFLNAATFFECCNWIHQTFQFFELGQTAIQTNRPEKQTNISVQYQTTANLTVACKDDTIPVERQLYLYLYLSIASWWGIIFAPLLHFPLALSLHFLRGNFCTIQRDHLLSIHPTHTHVLSGCKVQVPWQKEKMCWVWGEKVKTLVESDFVRNDVVEFVNLQPSDRFLLMASQRMLFMLPAWYWMHREGSRFSNCLNSWEYRTCYSSVEKTREKTHEDLRQ